ncbi:MAG: hypothetical protein AAGA54_33910, partial [Myxococcota bacterium]
RSFRAPPSGTSRGLAAGLLAMRLLAIAAVVGIASAQGAHLLDAKRELERDAHDRRDREQAHREQARRKAARRP